MHVHFHGLTPSKELERTFASHAIRLTKGSSLPTNPPDLILFRIKAEKELALVHTLKRKTPSSWVVLIVGEAELRNAALYTSILNCEDKNSVWHTETWEGLIWFSIQELTRTQKFEKELAILHSEVEESHRNTRALVGKLEKDLAVAERIQEKLVPSRGPNVPGIQIVSKYIAAPGLGGDYFDIFEIQEGRQLGLLLVDSETHGMVAALLSVLLKLRIEDFKRQFESASSFLHHLERELNESTNGSLDQISIFFGILDRKTFELRYASTGHISPILWRQGKAVPFTDLAAEVSLPLSPGDTLFLSTNGLYKIIGNEEALLRVLAGLKDPISLNQLKNALMGKIDAFKDQKNIEDDITFVEIGIDPKALVLKKSS